MACFLQFLFFREFRYFYFFAAVLFWNLSGFHFFLFLLGWGEQWSVVIRNSRILFFSHFAFSSLWCGFLWLFVPFWTFQCKDWHSSLWMRKLSVKNVVDPVHLALKWCVLFTRVCMLLEGRTLAEINIFVLSKIISFDKYHHSLIQTLLATVILVPFRDSQDQVSITWNWSQKVTVFFFLWPLPELRCNKELNR